MDGKKIFEEYCKAHGIECEKYFKIGKGARAKGRFKYHCEPSARKDTQIYAIKYFEEENVYVAWNLREPYAKQKSDFSLSTEPRVTSVSISNVEVCTKGIVSNGHNEETVLKFGPEGIGDFIRVYATIATN